MKKLIYSLFLLAAVGSFTSCHEVTTEDTSKVTYYATLELLGESTILWNLGEEYVDPGFTAMEGSEDVTAKVEVDYSAVDTNTVGIYSLTYSVINQDGFPSYAHRDVIVYDQAYSGPNLAGDYTVAEGSYRDYYMDTGEISRSSFSGLSVSVEEVAPGFFYVSDLIGGYYDQGLDYGSAYAMVGYFKLNDDNSIDILSGDISAWGNSMDSYENAYYDEATGTINWDVAYAGLMVFHISLGL